MASWMSRIQCKSGASEALMFCFDNTCTSSEKSCFIVDLGHFGLLTLHVFVFLNANRRE